MKTTLTLIGLMAALAAAGCRDEDDASPDKDSLAKEIKTFTTKAQELSQTSFDTGIMLGYSVAVAGGGKADIEFVRGAVKSNRLDLVQGWFAYKQIKLE